jgi:CRP/FNR family cyclic AMP-dependent transcriptional regulator
MSGSIDRPTLPDNGLFHGLREDDRDLLATYGQFMGIQPDHDMIRQGDSQTHLYYVINGKLEVRRQGFDDDIVVGLIQTGESFGEMSVFDEGPASASIRALEFSQIWKIDGDSLKAFLNDNPVAGNSIMICIATLLSQRVRKLSQQLVDARQS